MNESINIYRQLLDFVVVVVQLKMVINLCKNENDFYQRLCQCLAFMVQKNSWLHIPYL